MYIIYVIHILYIIKIILLHIATFYAVYFFFISS